MSELKEFGACRMRFAGESPWFTSVKGAVGRVESEEGGETSELNPSGHQMVVLDVRFKMMYFLYGDIP
jgi:hypothetical protein